MKTIEGNLLDQSPGILCHQVNLRGIMGAGIALQIRQKWPTVCDDYVRFCEKVPELGDVLFTPVDRLNPNVVVANLFGQTCDSSDCQTVYSVYPEMLTKVYAFAMHWALPIHIPYGIGCGIAGGDWSKMQPILEARLPDAILVRYQP